MMANDTFVRTTKGMIKKLLEASSQNDSVANDTSTIVTPWVTENLSTDLSTHSETDTTEPMSFSTVTNIYNVTDFVTSYTNSSNVTTTSNKIPNNHETEQRDLIWVLPAVFGIVFFLFGIACFLIYFIRRCEIAIQRCCYTRFGWCPPADRDKRSYKELKEDSDLDVDTFYMRDIRQKSPFDADVDK